MAASESEENVGWGTYKNPSRRQCSMHPAPERTKELLIGGGVVLGFGRQVGREENPING